MFFPPLADEVEHFVDSDATDELAIGVHYRCRHEVVASNALAAVSTFSLSAMTAAA
jgi:hypothetical protein